MQQTYLINNKIVCFTSNKQYVIIYYEQPFSIYQAILKIKTQLSKPCQVET